MWGRAASCSASPTAPSPEATSPQSEWTLRSGPWTSTGSESSCRSGTQRDRRGSEPSRPQCPPLLCPHRESSSPLSSQRVLLSSVLTESPPLLCPHRESSSPRSSQRVLLSSVLTESPPLLCPHRESSSPLSSQSVLLSSVLTESPPLLCPHRESSSPLSRYYRNTHGVIIVYDVTNPESFVNVKRWLNEISQNCDNVCKILVGNKDDDPSRKQVDTQDALRFGESTGVRVFETSAKENINVEEMFMAFTHMVLWAKKQSQNRAEREREREKDTVNINAHRDRDRRKRGRKCC
uniref:Si:dkey-16l2.16 n=1 Tax=Gasterosteus aculeatus aculeatus TaxID=481459 RepID=A0AAQ4S5S7_GASAC